MVHKVHGATVPRAGNLTHTMVSEGHLLRIYSVFSHTWLFTSSRIPTYTVFTKSIHNINPVAPGGSSNFPACPGHVPSPCPTCGGQCLNESCCGSCHEQGEGNFCGSCGCKRLRALKSAGGTTPTVRPSEVFDGAGGHRTAEEEIVGGRSGVIEETITLGGGKQENWNVTFINLPSAPGQYVELLINQKSVYRSDGINNRVNGTFTVPTAGWSQTNAITLKLPVVHFVLNKNYRIDEGLFIRFQADDVGGLKVRRQHTPFA